jgi:hypothetical protein
VSETNRTHATGRIEVERYEPQPYDEVSGGPNVVEMHVREAFKGDIEAKGVVRFLQAVRDDGSAGFVGIERVTGTLGARQGSFLLQDMGTLEGSTVNGEWFVIPASGTGELTGLRDEGGFVAELGSVQLRRTGNAASLKSRGRQRRATCRGAPRR